MKRRPCKRCKRIRTVINGSHELCTSSAGVTVPCPACYAWLSKGPLKAGAPDQGIKTAKALQLEDALPKTPAARFQALADLARLAAGEPIDGVDHDDDPVSHPAHYTQGGVEVIDAIEAWALNFRLGNAVKYIARAGKKDPAKLREDLEKARWYLEREIAAIGAV